MRIYLDNCVYNRPFDDQSQERIKSETDAVFLVKDLVETSKVELIWSYIVQFELSRNPFPKRRESIAQWRQISSKEVGPSVSIVSKALDFRNLGLKEIDSLHAACAVAAESDYFVTVDDGILRKKARITEISIIGLLDFVSILEEL